MRLKFFLLFYFPMFLFFSCSSPWLLPKQRQELNKKYAGDRVYSLKKTLVLEGRKTIVQGKKVKILFRYDDEWIKVYAYEEKVNRVEAIPVQALFLLRSDFENENFDEMKFQQNFQDYFLPVK